MDITNHNQGYYNQGHILANYQPPTYEKLDFSASESERRDTR